MKGFYERDESFDSEQILLDVLKRIAIEEFGLSQEFDFSTDEDTTCAVVDGEIH